MCRAMELLPHFMRHARVEVLVSGTQVDVSLPFTVKHRCEGLGFVFGDKGGIDYWATFRLASKGRFIKELMRLPVEDYDLVVNDFEPVSAWAARMRKVPCIGLSHQAAVLKDMAPQPDVVHRSGVTILKHYAPASMTFGFHFAQYDQDTFTPIIRQAVRKLPVKDLGHITVYLPAYADRVILDVLSKSGGIRWEVFSKQARAPYSYGNILVLPVHNGHFVRSMANSTGVLCGAGFETPAEALFLGKKLMVIPMAGQYEQHCNAAALTRLGVPVLPRLHTDHLPRINRWLSSKPAMPVNYPDNASRVVEHVLSAYCHTMSRQVGPVAEMLPLIPEP